MSLRISHWVWGALLIGASVMLYHTSYRVQELERQIATLEAARTVEQENIHVLEAEWAALTAPARLQRLSEKFLELRPIATKQIVQEHKLARMLPRRDAGMAVAASDKQQLALAAARGLDAR